ncbi:hypothetical protein [Acinetobacter nosocomialis]|uniref:hypothetical protein n=1 Tax=Acinetobacter nosocomialis TaxID=106654 RepID=UPI0019646518|nr:hypothetical protein [Acinetobacter nosocomialis]MBM9552673.1 hypothetical protein [Acinetobacter nosocomialis]
MSIIKFEDLNELEQEFIDCLFTYYESSFLQNEACGNIKTADEPEKRIIVAELSDIQRKVLNERLHLNDLILKEINEFHQLILGENTVISPMQIVVLLEQLNALKDEFDTLSNTIQKKRYSVILQAYQALDENICTQRNLKILKRMRGIRAVKVRNDKNVYPRHQILYRVLRDEAHKNGRWENLSQAVKSILPILRLEYQKNNLVWIQNEIDSKLALIEELEKGRLINSHNKQNENYHGKVYQNRKYQNRFDKLQLEINELIIAQKSTDPALLLGKKIPYNTIYNDESILHHLRDCTELLQDILIQK